MKKVQADKVIEILSQKYPMPKPALEFSSEYQLLVAVILSAQCTDKRVNEVTRVLFDKYPTPEKMMEVSLEELKSIIFPCGLYNNKAKNILSATKSIIEKFSGQVPSTFEELLTLDGVGRKTANVVVSVAFNTPAIAVDTHVFRVSQRIGLAKGNTPDEVEEKLKKIIDKDKWSRSHHYLIFLGRERCKAINPDCDNCEINHVCEKKIKKRKRFKEQK